MFQGIIVQESDPGFKVVELCHYNDGDYDYYAFVAVNPEKYPVFKKAYRKGNNIKISGVEVIYEAEGKVPTLDIIRKVTENMISERKLPTL
jgi:hypothetical protein